MHSATSRQLRNAFPQVLRRVKAGESVAITNRGKVVATLNPPAPTAPRRPWADAEARLTQLFPTPLAGTVAELISADRE